MGTRAQQKGYNLGRGHFFQARREEERIGRDRKYKMEARQFLGVHGRWPQSCL